MFLVWQTVLVAGNNVQAHAGQVAFRHAREHVQDLEFLGFGAVSFRGKGN